MAFHCALCERSLNLQLLAELPCSCLVCVDCTKADLGIQLSRQQPVLREVHAPDPRGAPLFDVGETVLYLTKDGTYVEATIEIIDISVQPPQYGIQLPGAGDLRFTEQNRLCSTKPSFNPRGKLRNVPGCLTGMSCRVFPSVVALAVAAAAHSRNRQKSLPERSLSARCPRCLAPVDLAYLRLLAPSAVEAWEAERTKLWLQANDIMACPHAGCGALIQRVPASATAGATAAGEDDGGAAGGPASRTRGASKRHIPSGPVSTTAAAHRERHRYRCGACRRDFCDACLAAPYHTGLTCRQARAPDCVLCAGKVDEDRLEQLLPEASSAAAAEGIGGRQRGYGGAAGGDAAAAALAVVRKATRADLLRALKKLQLDTVWCLERRDLEKAFMHWGYHTCSSAECAARRKDMCGRPLPCGHWCCGLRGEADAAAAAPSASTEGLARTHPRCVECGKDPCGSNGDIGTAFGAAAALVTECCFCWEALSNAPCIEMACGSRHMCHLHCALARLTAGYPGPHISFTHLYCPICRGGPGGSAGPAGMSPGGSVVQVALGPVHLDHPALRTALEPHLALRSEVVAAVRVRLKLDPALRADPDLRPGGRFDGRPADYGLERLTFYKCSKCTKVYYGGQRACGAAAAEEQQRPQGGAGAGGAGGGDGGAAAGGGDQALVCGECCARASGTNCPRHGNSYIEWKCRYCCSLASWFCFGTTHMCEPCHSRGRYQVPPKVTADQTCTDPSCTLKGIPHPPPGNEACLGCGMCRAGL